jgi:antitoxin (DNA-binding transcriptional repressor) of toxin-antitoxin stability system
MIHVYNMHEAKTNLSKLVKLAEAGEKIVIARAGMPSVELTIVRPKPRPKLGEFEPLDIWIPEDFDALNPKIWKDYL